MAKCECETMLDLKIDVEGQGENHTMADIDQDIFLLALLLQILRSSCKAREC